MSRPLVCGFADEATAIVGLGWRLGAEGGLLVRKGETATASVELESKGERLRLELEAEGLAGEAMLTPRPTETALRGEEALLPGEPSAAICQVRARLRDGGGERKLDCAGHLTRWRSDPTDGADLFRHIAIPGPERSLLVLIAARPAGADNHADEQVSAWRLGPEGDVTTFDETLLSTQYDEGGIQVRAGLELWSSEPEAPPIRAAGRLEQGTAIRAGEVTSAALHTSAEGTDGIGSYLIWRR